MDVRPKGPPVAPGTLADSLKRFVPLFEPLAEAILAHQNKAALRHADETSWRVQELRGEDRSSRAWLWVSVSNDAVSFHIDPSRSAEAAQKLFGDALLDTVIVCDRYSAYKRLARLREGKVMRALTRLGIVVESISKFACELERYHPGLHEQISKEVIRRYVDREGNGAFANTAPSVSKRRLGEAGQDLLALVLQFRDTAAAKLFSFAILERVLRDQFEIVDDECGDRDAKRAAIRDPKDVPCDTVGNPADPDASYNAHKGQGYMAQIVETYCEDDSNEAVAATPDLITHVEVHKMTVHDGHRLADALDDLSERALTPAVMLGDSHYGSSDNMALTREQNINLVAPARPPKGAVSGRLTLEDFTLNEEGLVLRCPNNVEPVSASLAKAKLQARFDLSICQKCPDILRCPVQAAKRDGQFSRFQYTPARAANQKRRLYEQSDAFRNVYRWRAGIEATMSRLKYQMNLAHLRIRGMPAMRYVVNLRALGLNIRRCAAIAP